MTPAYGRLTFSVLIWQVGWANSSLRHLQQLPAIPDEPGKGVFREDPMTAGMAPAVRSALDPATLEQLQRSTPSDGPSGSMRDGPGAEFSASDHETVAIQAANSRDGRHTSASRGIPGVDGNNSAIAGSNGGGAAASGGGGADGGGRSAAANGVGCSDAHDGGRSAAADGAGDRGGAGEPARPAAAAVMAASPKEGAVRPAVVLQVRCAILCPHCSACTDQEICIGISRAVVTRRTQPDL